MNPFLGAYFVILVIAVVLHEVAHGYAALLLGDTTAKDAGRLTLNPIKHIDLLGSIIVPVVSTLAGVPFGWAKPVPFNPDNLRNKKWGEAIVAAAGPATNLLLGLIFAIIFRLAAEGVFHFTDLQQALCALVVLINIGLAIFNLLPMPPLDGSKILFALIPARYSYIRQQLEHYQLALVAFVILFAGPIIQPVLNWVFFILTGVRI